MGRRAVAPLLDDREADHDGPRDLDAPDARVLLGVITA